MYVIILLAMLERKEKDLKSETWLGHFDSDHVTI